MFEGEPIARGGEQTPWVGPWEAPLRSRRKIIEPSTGRKRTSSSVAAATRVAGGGAAGGLSWRRRRWRSSRQYVRADNGRSINYNRMTFG